MKEILIYRHYPATTAHIKNIEFQVVPVGQLQVPPIQLVPPVQVELLQSSPAPAALKQVLVATGDRGHDVQG